MNYPSCWLIDPLISKFKYTYPHPHTHTHTQTHIYTHAHVFGPHFFVNTYLIKQYRHPLSTHSCIYPFESPYRLYGMVNYPIEINHYASLWYQFNSTTSKKHSHPKTEFRKILTKNTRILEQQNNKKKITDPQSAPHQKETT